MIKDVIIVKTSVSKTPYSPFSPLPGVNATFSNGVTKRLFSFNPDDLDFKTNKEFIGLTEIEASNLMFDKNISFLNP
ncbi:MAG: hypothetical protein ACJAWS_002401 [Oleiphilaceae bacterium]|jgi:hypothetical protein